MAPRCAQSDTEVSRSEPKVIPESPQSDPKIIPVQMAHMVHMLPRVDMVHMLRLVDERGYSYRSNNSRADRCAKMRAEHVHVFLALDNTPILAESPGCLFFCAPTTRIQYFSQSIVLGQIVYRSDIFQNT